MPSHALRTPLPSAAAQALARLRNALPRGQTLPEDEWRKRHGALIVLLCLHAVGLSVFAIAQGYGAIHALGEGAVLVPMAVAAYSLRRRRRIAGTMVALGLITCSALVVHISGGVIEAHFHFFVMVIVLSLYEDWIPLLIAAAYVVLHHGAWSGVDPHAVYNHPDALAHPWKWAAIHGGFVIAAGLASIVAWRLNESARAQTRAAYRQTRQILETAHDAFISIDERGRITDSNAQAEATFGWGVRRCGGVSWRG